MTGGAHGIGKSAAQHLAEEGATVPITDVDDESGFMTGSGPVVDDGYTVQ